MENNDLKIHKIRSKSCKKELWTQINTAMQNQTKWQRYNESSQINTEQPTSSATQNGQASYYPSAATSSTIFPTLPQGMQIVVDYSNLAACLPPSSSAMSYEKKFNSDEKWDGTRAKLVYLMKF